jgi:hypothetical protein
MDALGTSISNNTDTVLPFATLAHNTHDGTWNTSTNRFTAPISGLYDIRAIVTFASENGWAVNERAELEIRKNGSVTFPDRKTLARFGGVTGTSIVVSLNGGTTMRMDAGDYIEFYINQNSGGTVPLSASAQQNHFSINKRGGIG